MNLSMDRDGVEQVLINLLQKAKSQDLNVTKDESYSSAFVETVSAALEDKVFVSIIYLYRAERCIDFLLDYEDVEGNGESFRQRQSFLCSYRQKIKQLISDRVNFDHS